MDAKMVKKVALAIVIPLLLILLAAAGAAIWYFLIYEPPPKVFDKAVQAARARDEDAFKAHFSTASVKALEGSWSGESYGRTGSWESMMLSILEPSGAPPEIIELKEFEDVERARLRIQVRGHKRWVHFVQDDGDWKIDVLTGINANVSEEARKAKEVSADPDEAKKIEKIVEEPKKDDWWKKEQE